uniref:Uncharacterized protein n=1 Tax=Pundamilia nyererei TaxID=303518 RepID=A0A3B4FWM1_9CICH
MQCFDFVATRTHNATRESHVVCRSHNTTLVIVNVISTVDLGCCLDLKFIARRMWNVQYKPQVIREPKATATIFRTGKIICLGTKSVEESRLAARKFVRKLQKFGFPVHFLNFKIQNIVAYSSFQLRARHEPDVLARRPFTTARSRGPVLYTRE